MPMTVNGISPTIINYNGTSLNKVIYNGVTVWNRATPYTITDFTQYTWVNSKPNGSEGSYDEYVTAEKLYLRAEKTGGNEACNQYSGTLNTQGCNWMRVKYACYDDDTIDVNGYICGAECEPCDLASPKYVYIPLTGNTINFTAQIWSHSHHPSSKSLHILEIYFYYE